MKFKSWSIKHDNDGKSPAWTSYVYVSIFKNVKLPTVDVILDISSRFLVNLEHLNINYQKL